MVNKEKLAYRQRGMSSLLLISLFVIGIVTYLFITSFFPFKDKLLSILYPKPVSRAATSIPVGQSGDWTQIFNDEFDTATVDTSKWTFCYPWDVNGCTNSGNNELQWYVPDDVVLSNGILHLKAEKRTVLASDGKTYNYTAGMITTGRSKWDTALPARFTFQYGYIEMKAKVPKGQGLWPAFWLLPFSNTDPGKWPPEIDILETLGHETNIAHMTYHWLASNGSYAQMGGSYTGPDFSADFHTFAVDWEPEAIVWYIDGVERYRYTDTAKIPAEPMYILANLAVGGNWPGSPDTTTVFPAYVDIDYIRVWKKGTSPTLPPTGVPTPTSTPIPSPTPTSVITDTIPPTVQITSPSNLGLVPRGSTVQITATATDNIEISKVDFLINGSLKCSDSSAPYGCTWKVPNKKNTTYNITAKAYDRANNYSVVNISIKSQ